jgi:hypothetical protein
MPLSFSRKLRIHPRLLSWHKGLSLCTPSRSSALPHGSDARSKIKERTQTQKSLRPELAKHRTAIYVCDSEIGKHKYELPRQRLLPRDNNLASLVKYGALPPPFYRLDYQSADELRRTGLGLSAITLSLLPASIRVRFFLRSTSTTCDR